MNRKKKNIQTLGTALLLAMTISLTGCLFGSGDGTGAQESAPAGQSQEAVGTTAAKTGSEATEASPSGPVTKEAVAADLNEAIATLTGAEGAENAHLLGADGQPMAGFAYEGGAAIAARYVKIETQSVTGQGDQAQAELTVTSPDLYPLIEKAVEKMESFDEEVMNQNLEALLTAGGYAETAYQVTVGLVRIDGTWYIEPNEDLQNALSGGLLALEKAAAPTVGGTD